MSEGSRHLFSGFIHLYLANKRYFACRSPLFEHRHRRYCFFCFDLPASLLAPEIWTSQPTLSQAIAPCQRAPLPLFCLVCKTKPLSALLRLLTSLVSLVVNMASRTFGLVRLSFGVTARVEQVVLRGPEKNQTLCVWVFAGSLNGNNFYRAVGQRFCIHLSG